MRFWQTLIPPIYKLFFLCAAIGLLVFLMFAEDVVANSPTSGAPILVGNWELDELSGLTLKDFTSYKNNGSLNKQAIWREGYIGAGSILFDDGVKFTVPPTPSLDRIEKTQAMTLSFWLVPYDTKVNKALFLRGGNDGIQVNLLENRTIFIDFNRNYWSFPNVLTYGAWNHVAITVQSNQLKLYVNGREVGSKTFVGKFKGTGALFGGDCDACDSPSQVDDIKLYDGALSALAVQTMAAELKKEKVPPTMPTGFKFMGNNDRAANFAWQASTDNIAVRGYQLYVNGKSDVFTSRTQATVQQLEADTSYRVEVRAVDLAGNLSPPTTPIRFQTDETFDKNKNAVGINMEAISDWSREMPFVNVFKSARPWSNWDHPGYKWDVDNLGNIRSLAPGMEAHTMIMQGQDGQYKKGKYIVTYDGVGELKFWDYDGSQIIRNEPGRIEIDVQGDGIWLTLKSVNPDNYLRNIAIVHESDWDDYEAGKVFRQTYLDRWRDFRTIRFMDLMETNNSTVVQWSDRITPQHMTQSTVGYADDKRAGMSVEYMVQLCNELQSDAWFNMPAHASDDYMRQFADYVYEHLDPKLKVYIEYSNETWNGMFEQYNYAVAEGKKLGYTGPDFDIAAKYHAYRAKQMFIIWEQVFGSRERLVNVLGGFTTMGKHFFEMIVNHENVKEYVDVYAGAAYFGGNFGGSKAEWVKKAKKTDIFHELRVESIEINRLVQEIVEAAKPYGIEVVAYEGGQHISPVFYHSETNTFYQNDKLLADKLVWINRQPEMTAMYKTYMDDWKASGAQLHMTFSSAGAYTKYGSWGLLEYETQDAAGAPKWKGISEWMRDNPVWWNEVTPVYFPPPAAIDIGIRTPTELTVQWAAPNTVMAEVGPAIAYEVVLNGQVISRTTKRSAKLTDLKPDTVFRIGVRAVYGNEKKSGQLKMDGRTIADLIAPSVVKGVTVSVLNNQQVQLSWQAASDNDELRLYEILLDNKVITSHAADLPLTKTIGGLVANTVYKFSVRAVDRSGQKGIVSSMVTANTGRDNEPPTKPLGQRIIANRVGTLVFTWDEAHDNKKLKHYNVYNYGKLLTSTSDTRATIVTAPQGGNWLELSVRAVDTSGNLSEPSDPLAAEFLVDTRAPDKPSGVSVNQVSASGLTLAWEEAFDNVGTVQYEIFRGNFFHAQTSKGNAVLTSLKPDTSYTFRVRAIDAKELKSEFSNPITVRTLLSDMSPSAKANLLSAKFEAQRNALVVSYQMPNQSRVTMKVISPAGTDQVVVLQNVLQTAGLKSQSVSTIGWPEGMYRLQITVASVVLQKELWVDRTAPRITNVNQPEDIRVRSGQVMNRLEFTLSEPSLLTVSVLNTSGQVVHRLIESSKSVAGTYRFLWEGTDNKRRYLADERYTYRVEVSDLSGLNGQPVSRSFLLDRSLPTATEMTSSTSQLRMLGNNRATFQYTLSEEAEVTLRLFDAANRNVLSFAFGKQQRGKQMFVWDGRNKEGDYLPNQRYTFKLFMKDGAGNENLVNGGAIRLLRDFP